MYVFGRLFPKDCAMRLEQRAREQKPRLLKGETVDVLKQGGPMRRSADSPVTIQTSSQSVPSTPCWFGEVVLLTWHLKQQGVLDAITEHVRFARRRFGRYEVIDFVAVLIGYAVSSERTLEAFYERLSPWTTAFMALFGRDRLPARSTLSRFSAALTSEPADALRTLFLEDLLGRQQDFEQQPCGLTD